MAAARDFLESGSLAFAGLAKDFAAGPKSGAAALAASARALAIDKKIGSRKSAEQFLKALTGHLAQDLRDLPSGAKAENLLSALEAQENLNRNVSPQMVLDALLLSIR